VYHFKLKFIKNIKVKTNNGDIFISKFILGFTIFLLIVPVLIFGQSKNSKSGTMSQLTETDLGFDKIIDLTFEQALTKVKQELKKEGFGVLTEVDVKATMKNKLDVDFRPYQILGVCNPPLAHKSLMAEEQIGLMLPCKFIVYVNKKNKTVVAAVDPAKMMQNIENEKLTEVAKIVQQKFKKVLENI
jgi:uncharacterized protein (DUF302 family)